MKKKDEAREDMMHCKQSEKDWSGESEETRCRH